MFNMIKVDRKKPWLRNLLSMLLLAFGTLKAVVFGNSISKGNYKNIGGINLSAQIEKN